ncbi:MAG: ATP synthase F1 subunit gamma [Deltaproteobacteria bacterium]|nr:ATP synthase F1 subunit gamma [Deltaproteobacteria bacterium]TLN03446.1 MAG: ATP synthase F1 subunit gamma [bacterium]
MASLKSIRKRINSVKSTRQITKAMKMVAAAKLRRAQDKVLAARPYAKKLEEVLVRLSSSGGAVDHPLASREKSETALLIVVSSDRGLCGGFNANICKAAEAFMRENASRYQEINLLTIGRKGFEYLRKRATIRKNYSNILSTMSYQEASIIGQELIEGYLAQEYDDVYLLYNAFRSVMSQDITLKQLLPIEPPQGSQEEFLPEAIYEPSREDLLAELFPKNIEVQLFHAMLESIASEHGARMTAMDSASKNASEMIAKLTLQYNRARQAVITTELMEIISGAESVNG